MTASGGYIVPSRTSILETLPKIVLDPPKLSPKYTTGFLEKLFIQTRRATSSHPWISLGLLIGIVIAFSTWGRGQIRRRARGMGGSHGFFQLDGKEGLLNGGGLGKVD